MKNKKGFDVSPISLIIAMAIGGIILWIIFGPVIKGILVEKQIGFIEGKTEETTRDCDEDGVLGVQDKCPCVPNKDKDCGEPNDKAKINCPILCKSSKK